MKVTLILLSFGVFIWFAHLLQAKSLAWIERNRERRNKLLIDAIFKDQPK